MMLRQSSSYVRHLQPVWMLAVLFAGGAVAADELEEITVTATRMGHEAIKKEVVGRSSSTGAPIEHLTLTWSVGYSDLDLSAHSGATTLEQRIHARAKAVCHELDRLLPLVEGDHASCVNGAVDGAMAQAHRVIRAAEAKRAASAPK